MHFLIIAVLSLFLCIVYASPLHHDSDAISISRREPGLLFNVFHHHRKSHGCKTVKGSISKSLAHLANHTEGSTSYVVYYDVSGGFGGQSAVLKKLSTPKSGKNGKKAALKFVETQVSNLCAVNQLLNWGVQKGAGKQGDTYYVMMRKMGVPGEETGLDSDSIKKLQGDAVKRYHTKYHLEIQNPSSSNFAYYNSSKGTWQAEVIDWERAKLDTGAHLPQTPKPQEI
jgi:hypothetical protein